MKLIEAKAEQLHNLMRPNEAISPLLLLALTALIEAIIKMASQCLLKPQEMLDKGRKPGMLTKVMLRKLIYENLSMNQYTSVSDVIKHISTISAQTNEQEIESIQTEIRSK